MSFTIKCVEDNEDYIEGKIQKRRGKPIIWLELERVIFLNPEITQTLIDELTKLNKELKEAILYSKLKQEG